MFEFIDVSKKFRTDLLKGAKEFYALKNLSYKLKKNSLTGFLGANGAGKTTSLKIFFRFIKASSGEIQFDSVLGKSWGEIRSNIGYVPERPYFYPHLTGQEFIYFSGKLNDIKDDQIKKMIDLWATRLGIDHALERRLNGYSKGMLQRIGMLSALVHDPQLIVLDEPLSGLDPLGRSELKKAFIELQNLGKTIFFSSHIVSDVEEVCDEVVVIDKGELVYNGSVESIVNPSSAGHGKELEKSISEENFEVFCLGELNSSARAENNEEAKLHPLAQYITRSYSGGVQFSVADSDIYKVVSLIEANSSLKLQKVEKKRISLEEFVYHSGSIQA